MDHLIRAVYMKAFLRKGKLLSSLSFFYDVLLYFKKKYNSSGVIIFSDIVNKIYPEFNLRKLVLGGFSYTVPVEINDRKKVFFSGVWLLEELKTSTGRFNKSDVINLMIDTKNNTVLSLRSVVDDIKKV